MKKILLSVVAVAAIAVGYQKYSHSKTMSNLLLANVEALANGEGSGDCDTHCKPDYRYNCYLIYEGNTQGITCLEHRKK